MRERRTMPPLPHGRYRLRALSAQPRISAAARRPEAIAPSM
jgi:hypothetical protein